MKTHYYAFLTIFLFSSFSFNGDINWKKIKKEIKQDYSYIPSGSTTINDKKISVAGFFAKKTEVTNLEYREFLADVKDKVDHQTFERIRIKKETWLNFKDNRSVPAYERNYDSHPAFDNYPVVNITQEGAEAYCVWFEDKLKKRELGSKLTVRLPTQSEWIIAARAGKDHAPYPWGGSYLRNDKGNILANYYIFNDESIRRNKETGDLEIVSAHVNQIVDYTARVDSFSPNDYGLFNTSGNVAEMISEEGIAIGGGWDDTGYDIRVTSRSKFNSHAPDVGFRPIIQIGD